MGMKESNALRRLKVACFVRVFIILGLGGGGKLVCVGGEKDEDLECRCWGARQL